jgi:hypothetical protein
MSLKIIDQVLNKQYSSREVTLKDDQSCFRLCFQDPDSTNIIEVEIDYVLDISPEYKPEDYSLFIFKSFKLNKENNIFEVHTKEEKSRIGWIFPIQSLLSKAHDYADSEHFLKYAYVAFLKLLKNEEKYTIFNPEFTPTTNNYELTDFYGEDIIILILCNSLLQKIDNFQIDNYITSLYSYGYYFCQPTENLKEIDTRYDSENPTGKKLIIQKNSPCLQKEDHVYVYRLFKDLLKNEEHHLVRFYLLYQVMELMIQIVLERKILDEINNFKNNEDKNNNVYKNVFKLRKKIEDIFKETKRVSILMNDVKINNPTLLSYCNELIKLFNDDDSNEKDDIIEEKDLGGALYDVRCLIVHQFRKLPDKTLEEKLREINKEFENIVIKIILDYK